MRSVLIGGGKCSRSEGAFWQALTSRIQRETG